MTPDAFVDAARALVGDDHVQSGAAVEGRFTEPARYGLGQARAMVRPGNDDEVARLVRLAAEADVRLVPQGAHTGLALGATPSDPLRDVVVSTDRLKSVFEHDALDGTVRVAAGWRLSQVNAQLAGAGVFVAIDLSSDPSIGGLVAANAGGTRMCRYGDVRANTLGLTVAVAAPAGTLQRFGPALVKNNAGIDFKQLYIGTGGAFGIVTEAVLRVHQLPRQRAVAMVALPSREATWPFYAATVADFGDLISAFEGISGRALELSVANSVGMRTPFATAPAYAVLIELSSTLGPDALNLEALLTEHLAAQLDAGRLLDATVSHGDALWAIRHHVSEGLRAHGDVLGLDLSLPRMAWLPFLAEATAWTAARYPGVEVADFGHLGDGGVHFNLVSPRGSLSAARKDALRTGIYDLVSAHGGCFSAEHGIGPHVQAAYDRYTTAADLDLAGRVVQAMTSGRSLGTVRYSAPKPA